MTEEQNLNHTEESYKKHWYRLDNAAVIFSLVSSSRITALFRLSVTLKEPINVNLLQKAVENIIQRFPYFRVTLHAGLFWFYWREYQAVPKVITDSKYPCQEMPIRKKGIFPFRIRAFQNRIAVEFHHSITDGTGALTFLKALVGEYLNLKGVKIEDWGDIFRPDQTPDIEEYEDAYKKNCKKDIPLPKRQSKAFRLPFNLEKKGVYHITMGIVPVKKVISLAKERNVTITELLTAVYIEALQDILYSLPKRKRRKLMKPIRVSIPINLRRIYPSKSLRNFTLWVTPGIDPRLGRFSFDEILSRVYHHMRTEVNDKYINQHIRRNVRAELHPLIRITPLFIKKLFGKLIYMHFGEKQYSGSLSNLGLVKMPEPLNEHILDFQFIPGSNPVRKVSCAIGSFGDYMYITFGRVVRESEVEKRFFRKLVKMGVPVKIETN
ncbi:MAG: hypothetical protein ACTSQE_09680 [Candidatus Heimdallarchaeaceae archaeon]